MNIDLTHLPSIITTFVVVIPLIIAGILVTLGIANKQAGDRSKERQEEADVLADRVRNLYKEESDVQNERIQEQTEEIRSQGKRIATLEGENKTFRSLITGNDEQSKAYRARVEASLTLVDKLSEIIVLNGKKADKTLEEMSEGFNVVNKNIERLARAIEKKP